MKDIQEKPERDEQKDVYLSRMTAVSGGLIQAMQPIDGQKYLSVDGIDQCKEILKELRTGDYAELFHRNECLYKRMHRRGLFSATGKESCWMR